MASLVEIGPVVLRRKWKCEKMWKCEKFTMMTKMTTIDNGQILISKTHLSLRLRWVNNFDNAYLYLEQHRSGPICIRANPFQSFTFSICNHLPSNYGYTHVSINCVKCIECFMFSLLIYILIKNIFFINCFFLSKIITKIRRKF